MANRIRMCSDRQVADCGRGRGGSHGRQVQPSCSLPYYANVLIVAATTALAPIRSCCMRTSSIYKLCRNQHSPQSPSPSPSHRLLLAGWLTDYFVSNGLLLYLPLLHLLTAIRMLSKINLSPSLSLSLSRSCLAWACKFPIRVQVFAHCSWRC